RGPLYARARTRERRHWTSARAASKPRPAALVAPVAEQPAPAVAVPAPLLPGAITGVWPGAFGGVAGGVTGSFAGTAVRSRYREMSWARACSNTAPASGTSC